MKKPEEKEVSDTNLSPIVTRVWNSKKKMSEGDTVKKGMLPFRRLHKLSSSEDKQIVKLFMLYKGPYLVVSVYNNVAEIHRVIDR